MSELSERIAREHRVCIDNDGEMVCLCRTPDVDGPTSHALHVAEVTEAAAAEQALRDAAGDLRASLTGLGCVPALEHPVWGVWWLTDRANRIEGRAP